MAEIREEGGQFYRRRAGRRDWEQVSPEVAEAEGMGRMERFGRSAVGGAESLIRGGVSLLDRIPVDLRGERAPDTAEMNEARLDELAARQEAIEAVDPLASWGEVLPEVVAPAGRGLRGAIGIEAAIGALRQPEAPIRGAAQGAVIGAGAGALGAGVGALGRRLSRGTRRGLEAGEAVVNRSRQEEVRERLREGLFGMDAGDVRGTPGSITGLDTREIGQAANKGWGMRIAGYVDGAPDEELMREAAELGFRLTPGVARNSDFLRQHEAAIESSPGGAAAFRGLRDQNDQVLKGHLVKALGGEDVLRSVGREPSDLTPEALGLIKGSLENTFEQSARQIRQVDLVPAGREIMKQIDKLEDPAVRGWIEKIAERLPTSINGRELLDRLRNYRSQADSYWSGAGADQGKAKALDNLADVVERHMLRHAPPPVARALEEASERWRLLRTVERGKTITSDGDLSPLALDSALRAGYKNEFRYAGTTGNPQIERLFRASRAAYKMRDIVGNSGTATRSQGFLGQLTTGQLEKAYGRAYLEGLDMQVLADAAKGVAGTAGAAGAAGAGMSIGGGLLGD